MRISKLGGIAGACALFALPATGLAAGRVTPKDGKFVAKESYTVSGTKQHATLTLFASKDKLQGVDFVAGLLLPIDKAHSYGPTCSAASEIVTTGYTAKGKIGNDGKFSYTFSAKHFKDKVTVEGRFTDANHATGTFRDVVDPPGAVKSHCDTGKIKFAAAHS